MLELLTTFNPLTIITVIVVVCLAIKKMDDWFHWFGNTARQAVERQQAIEQSKECAEQHKTLAGTITQMREEIKTTAQASKGRERIFFEKYNQTQAMIDEINKSLKTLSSNVQELRESDVSDIKGYIIDAHDKFMALGYIDDQHLEVLDKRYEHYKAQGGNTYVDKLMEDLVALPLRSTKAVTEWKAESGH